MLPPFALTGYSSNLDEPIYYQVLPTSNKTRYLIQLIKLCSHQIIIHLFLLFQCLRNFKLTQLLSFLQTSRIQILFQHYLKYFLIKGFNCKIVFQGIVRTIFAYVGTWIVHTKAYWKTGKINRKCCNTYFGIGKLGHTVRIINSN